MSALYLLEMYWPMGAYIERGIDIVYRCAWKWSSRVTVCSSE